MTSIYNAVNVYYNYTGDVQCNDLNNQGGLGMDGWSFQACTEMVMPYCSNGKTDMFQPVPWNLTQFSNSCYAKYYVGADRYKALIEWGGKHIQSASNIIFSNGLRDPWSLGGVLESLSDTLIAIKIPGACHHEDLRITGPNDPQVLKDARQQELKIISGWLNKYYASQNKTHRKR